MSARVHAIATDGTTTELKAITGWSASEEATPITGDDTSGSVGGFSVTFDPQGVTPAELKALRKLQVDLDDLGQGRITGKGESIATQNQIPTLQVQSRLNLLSVQRTAQPFAGTMLAALTYYLGLVGITDMSTVYVDPDLQDLQVALVGWYQPVWNQLKKMGLVYGFEISLVSDQIVFRKLRTRIGQSYRDSAVDWAVDDSQTAVSIVVNYYEAIQLGVGTVTGGANADQPTYSDAVALGLVYPPGGWDDQVQVLTVAANETKQVQIDLGGSVKSIEQPIPVDLVGPYEVPGSSRYTITNADGTPMPPNEWYAMGGHVSVKVNDDTTTATVTMTGAGYVSKGPFSLSMHVVADGSDYSSLRLIGTGIAYRKRSITLQTGMSKDLAAADIGVTVDNEFIQSEAMAWDVAARTLGRFLGARQTIHVTTTGINRLGDTGTYRFQPVSWLTAQLPAGATAADVTALLQQHGATLADETAWIASESGGDFVNQAFGNIAGARVVHDGSWYRITSATIGPDSITYDATMDMLCGDISAGLPAGATVADLSAAFAGKTLADWDARPVPEGVTL